MAECPICGKPSCEGTHVRPEIDEAAAAESAEAFLRFVRPTSEIGIVARAALAWKARAEAAEAERDRLRECIREELYGLGKER